MTILLKRAYEMGAEDAAQELGMSEIPPELLALFMEQGVDPAMLEDLPEGAGTSEDFVEFVQGDDTLQDDQSEDSNAAPMEKDPHWSGQVSAEGGDAGSRNYNMGTPSAGPV